MNRGSALFLDDVALHQGRFNEAPIHESGKFRSRVRVVRGLAASMRPRFMNRGSTSEPALGCAQRLGRFNEAPIHESGKCKCSTSPRRAGTTRFNEAPIHESGK